MVPKWGLNGPQIGPKWVPNGLLELSWSILSPWGHLGALLGGSWRAPGAKTKGQESAQAVLKRLLRPESPILGAKRLTKRSPRRSKIESKTRSKLKTRILQKPLFFQWILMIFAVPGAPFGGPNRSNIGPKIVLLLSGDKKSS